MPPDSEETEAVGEEDKGENEAKEANGETVGERARCEKCGEWVETSGKTEAERTSRLLEHVESVHLAGGKVYGCSRCPGRFTSHRQFSGHSKAAHRTACPLPELLRMVTPEISAMLRAAFPNAPTHCLRPDKDTN